ncbi:MAG: hypothetical protein ACE5R6_21180 [Candidatus Heimdallarchaeota archaeon]
MDKARLVVGGGITDQGFKAYLVKKNPASAVEGLNWTKHFPPWIDQAP